MIKAYTGNAPYVFFSYAHKDKKAVFAILSKMADDGFRIWYDEGITPGEHWEDYIAERIEKSRSFIAFISDNYLASDVCLDEVMYARDVCDNVLLIYLEDVELSSGIAFRLRRLQSIFKTAYSLEKDFFNKIYSAKGMDDVRDKTVIAPGRPAASPSAASFDPSDVRLASYRDMIRLGYTPLSIAQRLVENDLALYPDLDPENEGTPEQWAEYIASYPESFHYIINGENKIVGNWSFLAVSEEIHKQKLLDGELMEESFRVDETEFIMFEGDYIGYLLNMSMNIGYNTRANINMLFGSFLDRLTMLAKEGIFFKSWYVNVFRKDHVSMYKRMGFRYLTDNKKSGKLFELQCCPFPNNTLFYHHKELRELYEEHFN